MAVLQTDIIFKLYTKIKSLLSLFFFFYRKCFTPYVPLFAEKN